MPNNIDERVVQMRIDNKQFVKGAEKTIGVLDNLKTALSFKEQTKELNEFQYASNRIDLSGITDAIENVSDRFTMLGIMGKRIVENLADSFYRTGKRMVESLSIDQVTEGYSKYEQKMKSVQTMMAATASKIGSDYANQLDQMEAINKEMDRLNFFTDETSYDFSSMSQNMAAFISAGLPVKNARIDMQGVAAAAGIAGASVQQATHAMNNLSQAMAMGKLTLNDWKSLEIASLVTDEFKKVLADTAVECGTLKKVGEDTYQTLGKSAKTFKSTGIREALSEGFVDSKVLDTFLQKYGLFSDILNSVSELTGATATDLLKALDEYDKGELNFLEFQKEISEYVSETEIPTIEALEEAMRTLSREDLNLGRRAFQASQEYNSFNDAINATKDAVSTGWMTTFEYIFGDYLEAKKVWTALGGELYDIFAAGAERRNAILEVWHDTGGREAFLESVRNLFDGFMSLIDPVKAAFKDIFNLGSVDDAADKITKLTKRFRDFTARLKLSEDASERLKTIFKTLFDTVQKVGIRALNGIVGVFKEFKRVIQPVQNSLRKVFTNEYISSFSDKIEAIVDRFHNFIASLRISDKALNGLEYILSKIFGAIKDGAKVVNANFFSKLVSGIGKVITFLRNLLNVVLESFSGGFSKDNLLTGLSELFHGIGDYAGTAWDKLVTFFSGVISFIDKIREKLSGLTSVTSFFSKAFGVIKNIFEKLKESLSNAFTDNNLGSNIIKIAAALAILIKSGLKVRDFKYTLEGILSPIKAVVGAFRDVLYSISETLDSIKFEIYGKMIKNFAVSMLLLAGALWILASIDIGRLGLALGATAAGLGEIIGSIKLLSMGNSAKRLGAMTSSVIKLATGILILAVAMKILSGIELGPLINSLAAVTILLVEMLAAISLMNALEIKPKKITGLVSIALAMLILAGAVAILGAIPYENLQKGLIALTLSLILLVGSVILLSKLASGQMLLIGAGMVALAVSLVILSAALALLSLIDPEKLANSLLILALALAAIAVITSTMPATLPLVGAGLVLVAIAVALIAASLAALTLIDPNKLVESLLIVVGALALLGVVLMIFQGAIVGALALLAVGAAMALASVGILVFAIAMQVLQTVPLGEIAVGMVAAGSALIILAAGLLAMTVGLIGAVALVVAAGGLYVLAIALNMMTGLDMLYIAEGLSALGFAFMGLGAGAIVLTLGVPGLIAGAAAIVLLGLAMVPFVACLHSFDDLSFESILKFLIGFGGTAAILALLTPILGPLSLAVGAFGVACLAAGAGIKMVGEGMEKIANSIIGIPDRAGAAFNSIAEVIKSSLTDIKANGEEVVKEIDRLSGNIIKKLNFNTPIIEGVLAAIINEMAQNTNKQISVFKTVGGNLAIGLANGIIERGPEAVKAMHYLASGMASQFMTDFMIHSPSRLMESMAGRIPQGAAKGINENSNEVTTAMSAMGSKMLESIYPALQVLSQILNEEYDFSPTIRPVVDMTEVASSSAAIQDMLSGANSTAVRASGTINAAVDNANRVSGQMDSFVSAGSSYGDTYTINVYSQPGMDENELANAVMYKIQNGIMRKGAALG